MRAPGEAWQRELHERERGNDIDLEDPGELVERIVGESRLRARAEHARVVHDQVDGIAGGGDERAAVSDIREVAGERRDVGRSGPGLVQCRGTARVDDESPAALD